MIDSVQTIEDYGQCRDEHPKFSDNAIEDYMATKEDVNNILLAINNGGLSPQFGEGSPEGVVYSNYSLKYIDTLIPTEYYNTDYGVNSGWIAL